MTSTELKHQARLKEWAIKWKIDNHDFTDEKERFERVKNALSK
jgi:hypothetical protein